MPFAETPCPDATREELIARVLVAIRAGPRSKQDDDDNLKGGPSYHVDVPIGTCRYCGRVLPWGYVIFDAREDPKPKAQYVSADDPKIAEWEKLRDDPHNIGALWIWPLRACEAAQDEEIYDAAMKRKEIEDRKRFGWEDEEKKKKKKKKDEDEPTPGGPREPKEEARNPYGGISKD